jgi:hypothetical protein
MLDGRSIIEVPAGTRAHAVRVWVVRYGRGTHLAGSRVVCQAVREPVSRTWYAIGTFGTALPFPTLRDVRRHFFRGNGRLTGGHSEIGESGAVVGPMSRVNVLALASGRTAPGNGEYWD